MAGPKTTILLTGGSGFVGNHTVNSFLEAGYRVRLACRNQATADRMLQTHRAYEDRLETTLVPDITTKGAFDEAVKGVDGVVHMASPFVHKVADIETDLIKPAVNGTTGILESVVAHAPKVEHVVITSSLAAVADFSKGMWPGHVYDESQWNPITFEETKNDKVGRAYAGSKKLAEEAAWRFVKETPDVRFTIATINPVMIYGPNFPNSADIKHLGQSAGEIYALVNGSHAEAPRTRMPVFVDVRDVAQGHLAAYETASPGRFLLCGGSYTYSDVCDLVRSRIPEISNRTAAPSEEDCKGAAEHYTVDTSKAEETLKIKFTPFEQTFVDMVKEFLTMEGSQ